jgi:hypothetical protein
LKRLALVFAFAISGFAHADTQWLGCWAQRNANDFRSRSERTGVVRSEKYSAYAEVSAKAITEKDGAQLCANTVRLYLSSAGSPFRVVFEKTGGENHGIGIKLAGWLHEKLLFQLTEWEFDSDAMTTTSALVLNSTTLKIDNTRAAQKLEKFFGTECEFDSFVAGWKSDSEILMRVQKTPLTESYEQKFCVQHPTIYLVGVANDNVKQVVNLPPKPNR